MMTCPICGAPAAPEHRPFCSARHRDRDLVQWLDEGYRIPVPDGVDKPEDAD